MRREHWSESLAPFFRGRPFIVTGDVFAATTGLALALRALGVERVLCVGVARGTGALPQEHGFEQILIDPPMPLGFMEVIREAERVLCSPPAEVLAQVDQFDPAHEAQVIAPFYATGLPQLNRPVFGARPASWRALEDKVVIDAVLSAAGLRVAPHKVVPVTRDALNAAAVGLASPELFVREADASAHHQRLAGAATAAGAGAPGVSVGLCGGAALIQGVRAALREKGVSGVKVKAYWAPGKVGLD